MNGSEKDYNDNRHRHIPERGVMKQMGVGQKILTASLSGCS